MTRELVYRSQSLIPGGVRDARRIDDSGIWRDPIAREHNRLALAQLEPELVCRDSSRFLLVACPGPIRGKVPALIAGFGCH